MSKPWACTGARLHERGSCSETLHAGRCLWSAEQATHRHTHTHIYSLLCEYVERMRGPIGAHEGREGRIPDVLRPPVFAIIGGLTGPQLPATHTHTHTCPQSVVQLRLVAPAAHQHAGRWLHLRWPLLCARYCGLCGRHDYHYIRL